MEWFKPLLDTISRASLSSLFMILRTLLLKFCLVIAFVVLGKALVILSLFRELFSVFNTSVIGSFSSSSSDLSADPNWLSGPSIGVEYLYSSFLVDATVIPEDGPGISVRKIKTFLFYKIFLCCEFETNKNKWIWKCFNWLQLLW